MRYWIPEEGFYPKSYVISGTASGSIIFSQTLLRHPLPFLILWDPNDPENQAWAANPPSANWTATLYRERPPDGETLAMAKLTILSGENYGTFIDYDNQAPYPLLRGERFFIQAPASTDNTLANLYFTLLARRP